MSRRTSDRESVQSRKASTKCSSSPVLEREEFPYTDISEDEEDRPTMAKKHSVTRFSSVDHVDSSEDEAAILSDDLIVEPGTPPQSATKIRKDASRSFYRKFRPQKSEEEAKANKTFAEMTLDEQSEYLSSQIANRFFEWVKGTGMQNLRINELTLKELFQVGMDNPSVRSLDINVRELATVPRTISELFRNYEKSERAALHRQILWDAYYEMTPSRYLAFGKRHPRSHKPWKKNVKSSWFATGAVSEDIISGCSLWGELHGTKVLENYCKWLKHNPHHKRPIYLQKMGYLDASIEDDKFNDDEMEEELKKTGQRNYWLFNTVKYLEEEEMFKEELRDHPEILEMLKE